MLANSLSQAVVTTQINAALAGYVPISYVSAQAAKNVTQAQITAAASQYLAISKVGAISGIAPLAVNGRIPAALLGLTSTQRYPSPFYSPASYWGSAQTASLTEVQLDTFAISNPGYAYRLMVTGLVDGQTSLDGQYPIIRVRVGSMTGPVIAVGAGIGEQYKAGVLTTFTNPGAAIYTMPSWYYGVDGVALGAGGGGQTSLFFQGTGGSAGQFGSASLIKGSTLPTSTATLNIFVGTGGSPGTTSVNPGAGTASTITGIGVASITGPGGAGQGNIFSSNGASAGSTAVNGNIYQGGLQQSTGGGTGNAPGGGGASGAFGATSPGGAGANGECWCFAYPNPNIPGGPIVIMPAPLNAQASLSGATTLYVTLVCSGGVTPTVTASTFRPLLQATPIPA